MSVAPREIFLGGDKKHFSFFELSVIVSFFLFPFLLFLLANDEWGLWYASIRHSSWPIFAILKSGL